jgi:hypothetical protein
MNKGWISWKKYESLFPHPNFIFVEEEDLCNSVKHIYIINKKSLLLQLHKHSGLYQEILGSHFSPESFLKDLEQKKNLDSLIKNDECLKGMILGFGPESSLSFKKKNTLEKNDPSNRADRYQGIVVKEPKRSMIFPVGFMGNSDSEEVKNLTYVYEKELGELWIRYKISRNTLKLVLEKLAEG